MEGGEQIRSTHFDSEICRMVNGKFGNSNTVGARVLNKLTGVIEFSNGISGKQGFQIQTMEALRKEPA